MLFFFFFQAEDGIRDADVTGVQTCALPIYDGGRAVLSALARRAARRRIRLRRGERDRRAPALLRRRSEEHTSELQSRPHLVCRLLLEKKKMTCGWVGRVTQWHLSLSFLCTG